MYNVRSLAFGNRLTYASVSRVKIERYFFDALKSFVFLNIEFQCLVDSIMQQIQLP